MKFNDVLDKIIMTLVIIIAYVIFGIGVLSCVAFVVSFIGNESLAWLFLTICIGVYLFGALCIIFNIILNKIWGLKNVQFPL